MDAIIIDIDGTIADLSHRLHHIREKPKDYDAFFAAMSEDTPISDILWLIDHLITAYYEHGFFEFFICTGRPEDYRLQTERWLREYAMRLHNVVSNIFMRPSKDFRKDSIIKDEMRQQIEGLGYNIRFVLDDRQQVVDMWRSKGITCLQVNQWGEEKDYPVDPGILHIMVGPSGGGKSTHAAKMFPQEYIISSDNLRAAITGDFQDMSKDPAVWKLLHTSVKARLEAGLDTVVDATNIKTHNRKIINDLQFPNGKIVYHVVNRILEEKIKTGGWRNSINIKGKTLIEYHEDVFNSNLKDILAGDGDKRVKIEDWR